VRSQARNVSVFLKTKRFGSKNHFDTQGGLGIDEVWFPQNATMPSFTFSAVDASGRSESGRMEALSESDAYRKLRERGLQPGMITAEGAVSGGVKGRTTRGNSQGRPLGEGDGSQGSSGQLPRLTGKQLLFFTEELAELLEAGLQLEGALKVIEERQE